MAEQNIIPDLILKLQLVGSSGLMIAELPESTDETKSQLSAGITKAIMAFTKEVHERDIEALTFADRSVVFMPIKDFIMIAEVSSTVSKENLQRLIEEFKARSEFYFVDLETHNTDFSEAQKILEDIYNSDWLEETISGLGYARPLINEQYCVVKFDHANLAYEVLEGMDRPDLIPKIIDMVNYHGIKGPRDEDFRSGFISISISRQAGFVVQFQGTEHSHLGIIIVSDEKSSRLFRLSKILQIETMNYAQSIPKPSISHLMKLLIKIRDHESQFEERLQQLQNEPIKFLEQYVKDVDKIIPLVILGEKLLIVGDEEDVDKVILGLHHFSEHLTIPHVRWLTEGQVVGKGLTGLSKDKLAELKHNSSILEDTIWVDTKTKKIEGKKISSNKFIKDLYKRSRNLPLAQATDIIKNQLYIIVSFAMSATSYAIKPKQELLRALQDMKVSIKDNGQFELIQSLVVSINPWLDAIINEVSLDDVWI